MGPVEERQEVELLCDAAGVYVYLGAYTRKIVKGWARCVFFFFKRLGIVGVRSAVRMQNIGSFFNVQV